MTVRAAGITPATKLAPWLVLLAGLLCTAWVTALVLDAERQSSQSRLRGLARDTAAVVEERLKIFTQAAAGGSALIAVHRDLTAQEWRRYAQALPLGELAPGIGTLGVAFTVAPENRDRYLERMRREIAPDFDITPRGRRAHYVVATYVHDFRLTQQPEHGRDLAVDPRHEAALSAAERTGSCRATAPVPLASAPVPDTVLGVVVYCPVITAVTRTPTHYTYAVARLDRLLNEVLPEGNLTFDLEVHDATAADGGLIYRSSSAVSDEPRYTERVDVDFSGRKWALLFTSPPRASDYGRTLAVALAGALMSVAMFLLLLQEVRQRRRATAYSDALQDANSRLNAIMQTAIDGIVTMDGAGIVRSFNQAAVDMFGLDAATAVGQPFARLLAEPDRREFESCLHPGAPAALAPFIGTVRELTAVRQTGESFPVEIALSASTVSGGRVLTAVVREISNRKNREATILGLNAQLRGRARELETANRDLSLANEELSSLSYTVSHDLRNTARRLQGMSELVLTEHGEVLSAAGVSRLRRVQHNAEHLGRVVDALSHLVRVGHHRVVCEWFDFTALAHRITDDVAGQYPGHAVRVEIAPDVTAYADRTLVGLALRQLVENAWKFTVGTPAAHVVIGRRADADEPTYFVRDNGAGFDMRYADKLFRPFERLHSDEAFDGTGIGLSLVRRAITKHQGRVWGESQPGAGACFSFTLPVAEGVAHVSDGPQLQRTL